MFKLSFSLIIYLLVTINNKRRKEYEDDERSIQKYQEEIAPRQEPIHAKPVDHRRTSNDKSHRYENIDSISESVSVNDSTSYISEQEVIRMKPINHKPHKSHVIKLNDISLESLTKNSCIFKKKRRDRSTEEAKSTKTFDNQELTQRQVFFYEY